MLPGDVATDPYRPLSQDIDTLARKLATINFAGRTASAHTIFSVTGLVYVEIIPVVATVFVGGGNISMGITGPPENIVELIPAETASGLPEGTIWNTGTGALHAENTVVRTYINNTAVTISLSVAATAGVLDVHVRYTPISDGAGIIIP